MPKGVYERKVKPVLTAEDLKKKILDNVVVDEKTGCWNWTLSTSGKGYAQVTIGSLTNGTRKHYSSFHKISYEVFVGPVPEGKQLDHTCRNRRCVFYGHLEPVTNRENGLRGVSPAAMHAKQTHCKRGHELTPENLYKEKSKYGWPMRRCRICVRDRQNARRKRGLSS